MKITTLASIGVVVRDLDKALEGYARLLDINEWAVHERGTDQLSEMVSRGRRSAGTYRCAFGSAPFDPEGPGPMGGAPRRTPFELVQPTGGETPFNEHLLSRGEGICFLTLLAEADEAQIRAHFDGLGITVAHSHVVDGRTRTFYDTRKQLGGYLLEVLPASGDAPTGLNATGGEARTLDGAALRGGRRAIPMQGINHFGVVIDDTMDSVEQYRRILGIEKFDVKTWQTEFGRLDNPFYRDQNPVQHGYFTAQGFVGDFGFEIIQCAYGDSHYNREFTDQRGAGIHHMFPFLTKSQEEWDAVAADMTALDAPVVMGSDLRGGASAYCYYDTFEQLCGFLVEGVFRRFVAKDEYMAPDWTVDFSTEIAEA
ncbi:VOC family protein [Luteococcus sp. OSA5]|uniref:VOC family protein n=1 Tax=Luteococcus sp. OSA5 TaxID=3401630 RepID=UPI003B4284DC